MKQRELGRRGMRKNNGGGDYDQSVLYECMEILP
jgi:hypothetical protein